MKKPFKVAIMLLASSALAGLLTKAGYAQAFDVAATDPVYKAGGYCFTQSPNLHWYMLNEGTGEAWDMTTLGAADPSFYAKDRQVRMCRENKGLPLSPPPPIDHVTGLSYHSGTCQVCLSGQGVFAFDGDRVQNVRSPTKPVPDALDSIVQGLCAAFE